MIWKFRKGEQLSADSIAARHVREVRAQGDPQFKFRFDVSLPRIPGFSGDLKNVTTRVRSISPLFEIVTTAGNAPSANSHWYFIEDDDVSAFTIVADEFADGQTLDYFLAWNRMEVNKDGTYNAPGYYKQGIIIHLLRPDFETPSRKFKAIGCFPSKVGLPEVSYEGSDILQIEVEIAYDSIDVQL